MRGDRPLAYNLFLPGIMATPHARGSTPRWRPAPPVVLGYPACAGIDPGLAAYCCGLPGLPRMRGDRPVGVGILFGPIFGTLGHQGFGFMDHSFCLNSGRKPMEICPGR